VAVFLPELSWPFKDLDEAAGFLRSNPSYLRRHERWLRTNQPVLFARVAGPSESPGGGQPSFDKAVGARLSEPEPSRGPGSRKPKLLTSSPRRTRVVGATVLGGLAKVAGTGLLGGGEEPTGPTLRTTPAGGLRVRSPGRLGVQAELPPEPRQPKILTRQAAPRFPAAPPPRTGGGGLVGVVARGLKTAGSWVSRAVGKAVPVSEVTKDVRLWKNFGRDIYDVITLAVPGTVQTVKGLATDPERTVKEIAESTVFVLKHPEDHPGLFALTVLPGGAIAARGVVRGAAARAAAREAIAEAERAGVPVRAGTVVKQALLRHPAKGGSLLRLPNPEPIRLTVAGQELTIPVSRNPIVEGLQRRYWQAAAKRTVRGVEDPAPSYLARLLVRPVLVEKTKLLTPQARLGRRLAREHVLVLNQQLGPVAHVLRLAPWVRKDRPIGSRNPIEVTGPRNTALGLALEWGQEAFKDTRGIVGTYAKAMENVHTRAVTNLAHAIVLWQEIFARARAGDLRLVRDLEGVRRTIAFFASVVERSSDELRHLPEVEKILQDAGDALRAGGKLGEPGSALVPRAMVPARRAETAGAAGEKLTPKVSRDTSHFLALYEEALKLSTHQSLIKVGLGVLRPKQATYRIMVPSYLYKLMADARFDPFSREHLDRAAAMFEDAVDRNTVKIPLRGEDVLLPPDGVGFLSRHPRYMPVQVFPTRRVGMEASPLGISEPRISAYMPEVTSHFTGANLIWGYQDVVGTIVSSYIATVRYSHLLDIWQKAASTGLHRRPLLPSGRPDPRFVPIAVHPNREGLQLLKQWELDIQASKDTLGKIPSPSFERFKQVLFPEGREVVPDHVREIPGYVWVDSRYIRDLLGAGARQRGPLLALVDLFNEAYRDLILYLAPKYGLNIFGNALMGLMANGPMFTYWAWKGMTLPQRLDERLGTSRMRTVLNFMDGVMGETKTRSFGSPMRMSKRLQESWNTVTDLWFRRAMFLQEAARHGFITEEQLLELFRLNERGRFVHQKTITEIGLKANRKAVDFDNALTTPVEREILRRLFIFYPWTRSAIEWTLRRYTESPVTQLASAIMTAQAQRMDLTPLPRWARSAGMLLWYRKQKAYSIVLSSVYTPLTLAQTMDALDELAGVLFRGERASGDMARMLQASLNVALGPVFGVERRGTIAGFIPEIPQVAAFRGSPTFPEAEPRRLIGGGAIPRLTAVERLRQQHEKELGKGVNEQRRWQRYGDRLIAIYARSQRLDEPTRRALKVAFKLRSEAALITAREGGEATPERKMRVLEALLKRAEELQPVISKLGAINVPEVTQAYREAVQRDLAARGLNLASKDERERADIVGILEGWQTRVINLLYAGNIVDLLANRLSQVPGLSAEVQLLPTD